MPTTKNNNYPKVECARCGTCCRVPIVPVTHKDLARLIKHTSKDAKSIVRFCSSSEMAYSPDAGLWIKFKSAKRAMVLRKRDDRCIYQTDNNACAVYEARPQTCRTFPYSVEFEDNVLESITLNKILKCKAKKCSSIDIDTLISNVLKENREDKEYHNLIQRWNDSNSIGNTTDFLRHIGF